MSFRRNLLARIVLALVPLALLAGCANKKSVISPHANIRPTIELTRAPYNQSTRFEYSYRMDWLGFDPDGRIDHYLYAIDPPSPTSADPEPDTLWTRTARSEELINFTASLPDSSNPAVHGSSDFHTFVVKAIDNGGLQSAPLFRSFFTYTVAPTVAILTPSPSDRGTAYVPPSIRISWTGTDDDGIFDSKKPVKYKFFMITSDPGLPVPYSVAISNPDSVRRYYAPRNWAGWDSTSGDTTSVQYSGLSPGGKYCFVVVAFDEAGAYSPVFSLSGNMLNMSITYAALGGPTLTMFNEIFFFHYPSGQYSRDRQYWIELEVGAGQPVTIHWFGDVLPGVAVTGYRWALDIDDVSDQTPRPPDQEQTDLKHWSASSEATTQATVGPFGGREEHYFYVEAADNNGLKSLGIVHMTAVQSDFQIPLGIVKDTRLPVDHPNSFTGLCQVIGRWPSSAEMDTFLFARGGFPWKCYPTGTVSTPGLFAAYSRQMGPLGTPVNFDTINTRLGRSEVRVPLATLGHYKHLIWLTDAASAIKNGPGTQLIDGLCALRYMTSNGHSSSIAAYVSQGGQVWLTGGGIGMASSVFYNKVSNDPAGGAGAGFTFSSLPTTLNELIPGRMMYDLVHWQYEFKVASPANIVIARDLARYDSIPANRPAKYNMYPPSMRYKSPATDPLPPLRTNPSDFYVTNFTPVEYMSGQGNYIQEDVNPNPLVEDMESELDTLFSATGVNLVQNQLGHNACMTIYHGHDTIYPIIFTGFSIWQFARADCQALVDAVLQGEWGLIPSSPNVVSNPRPSASVAAPPVWNPPAVSRGAPVTGAMVQGRVRDP